jgi:hypothetical protein
LNQFYKSNFVNIPLYVEEEENLIVGDYKLNQNYPNPFNPSTVIEYQLPENDNVIIKVYDVLGKEITTLVNEYQNAGRHKITFDASELSSGIYFYRMKAGNFIETKKMILMR